MKRRIALLLLVAALFTAPLALNPGASAALTPPGASAETSDGELMVNKLYAAFLRRLPDDAELTAGTALVDAGEWGELMRELSLSEEWLGRFVDSTYQRVLDRDPDDTGRSYWVEQLQAGLTTADILYPILRSEEFATINAANDSEVVNRLFSQILGREVDTDGANYWAGVAQELGAETVANSLFASAEYRQILVNELYDLLLCRDADEEGRSYWSDQLPLGGELELARAFVASSEFHSMSTECGANTISATEPVSTSFGGLFGINSTGSTGAILTSSMSIVDVATGDQTPVPGLVNVNSADGTKVLVIDGTDMAIVDLETSTSQTLGLASSDFKNYVLSNNGILYRYSAGVGPWLIERYDPSTDTLTEVYTTSTAGAHWVVAVSGDGASALLSLESESTELQLYRDGTLTPITSITGDDGLVLPRMSTDGTSLLTVSGSGSVRSLRKVDLVNDTVSAGASFDEAALGTLVYTSDNDRVAYVDPTSPGDTTTTLRLYTTELVQTGQSVEVAAGAQVRINADATVLVELGSPTDGTGPIRRLVIE